MTTVVKRFVREEAGQDLLEYALLGSLVTLTAYAAVHALAGR